MIFVFPADRFLSKGFVSLNSTFGSTSMAQLLQAQLIGKCEERSDEHW